MVSSSCECTRADEVFFTGITVEVVLVKEINKRKIGDGKLGPGTHKLTEKYRELVRDSKEGVPIH